MLRDNDVDIEVMITTYNTEVIAKVGETFQKKRLKNPGLPKTISNTVMRGGHRIRDRVKQNK